MSDTTKNSFVFGNKFRYNGEIYWKYIYAYPYSLTKNTSSMLLGIFNSPFTWYPLFYFILNDLIVDVNQDKYSAYLNSEMFSYLILIITVILHYIVFGLLIYPEYVDPDIGIGDKRKIENYHSYRNFYRVQWILLLYLSPIFVFIYVYLCRSS